MTRTHRREIETFDSQQIDGDTPFRRDLERIRFSPYYARLSAVTQVVGQTSAGPLVHNRLTHSLKVTAVARSVAVKVGALLKSSPTLPPEYVCDTVVAQAAASAHDLGHPPFGHLGEDVLDRLARESLGLLDGFEGNAQTYRILATLDVCHGPSRGLNLTAATRSAVAKYPWTPAVDISELDAGALPPGLRWIDGELSVRKYSAYYLDASDLADARTASRGVLPLQQSLEGSVMDIADDIAYSIHDIDDFHRAGLLSHWAVAREFREWISHAAEFGAMYEGQLLARRARSGSALELLRRKLRRDDPWIADDDAFVDAVNNVADDLVSGLLAEAFDGSIASERALSSFTSRWIRHLQGSVVLAPADNPRTGLVTLDRLAWHEVEVLKFVHRHFVLNRSDIAMYQRGLSRVLVRAVKGLMAWFEDPHDQYRVPLRLKELVEIATDGYDQLRRSPPDDGTPPILPGDERRLGTGRGVLDYVASLSDGQAMAVSEAIDGRPDRLWDIGKSL
ncbi:MULTISPECIES: dGTP triphosphohydrolase [unclassified Salinibacterium]|uniref:deoxyguanosinetriphosphate triphosphohydrolase family protein n=1 Tax=unclassified Salinibacterium TaxID=2632331 RepID=UPI0014245972|nr:MULTISPECIES: dNTP triphosphohydrolase [unclassified Salinibacterium]